MQQLEATNHQTVQELYTLTADLLVHEDKEAEEVKSILVEKGLSDVAAYTILQDVQHNLSRAKKEDARKDMVFGALWCIGGTIATFSNIRFIFWGVILFGCVQFLKGLVNYYQSTPSDDEYIPE